ncbi:MAG: 50S ribosomal protein L2 [Bacteroidetes bacterium]|nr:50S ribosomal protein L2 [Bacteroidota bacterium]
MVKLKFKIGSRYGRNKGRISSFHRERGLKKLYYSVDFDRYLYGIKGKIISFDFDRHRTGKIGLVYYTNGILSYVLCAESSKEGDFIEGFTFATNNSHTTNYFSTGSYGPIGLLTPGTRVYNLELFPGSGGKVSRSAGTFSTILKVYSSFVLVKLPSGEQRLFDKRCICNVGRVGNVEHSFQIIGKAGIMRKLGKRPIVRGRAMNPVDHPHGGRTNGGIVPKTPWGRLAKGVVTRNKKNVNKLILKRKQR